MLVVGSLKSCVWGRTIYCVRWSTDQKIFRVSPCEYAQPNQLQTQNNQTVLSTLSEINQVSIFKNKEGHIVGEKMQSYNVFQRQKQQK